MTDFKEICGFQFNLDEETGSILINEVEYEEQVKVSLSEISPCLLNKFLKYPENVYTQHKRVGYSSYCEMVDDLSYDLYYLPQGLLGIEFIKTEIFYSNPIPNKFACLIEVMSGELTVLIQKNKSESEYSFKTFVEEIDLIVIKAGERLSIPTGVYYTFVNTSSSHVVFSVVYLNDAEKIRSAKLEKEKGLALYIISKNARLEIVSNPKYKIECEPKQVSVDAFDTDHKSKYRNKLVEKDMPLLQMVKDYADELVDALA